MTNTFHRSWVEIDLGKIENNYRSFVAHKKTEGSVMAVVKANAYGHGDLQVASRLSACGVNSFAVSNVDEGIRLRTNGIKGEILVLGYTPIVRANDLLSHDLTQALLSEDYAELLADTKLPVKCQFAIDTGMRRIGIDSLDLDYCETIIRKYYTKLNLNGLFTHLCVADTDDSESVSFTNNQIRSFEAIVGRVDDLHLPFCHCMNSAGGLWHTSKRCGMCRLGIVLYGLKPDCDNILPKGIEPALTWKSVISMIKDVSAGNTIGYGRTFHVEKKMRIATIPTGYADGYNRNLSNKGFVLINGRKARIVGRICMDQMMVDATGIDDIEIGTEVVLIGKSGNEFLSADDMAKMAGTIGYETVCDISNRVERIYVS